jgi:hypothetical protein
VVVVAMKTVMAAAAMKRRRPSMTRTPLASRLHKRRGIPIRSLCACLSFAIAADGYPNVRDTQAGGCKSARMHLPMRARISRWRGQRRPGPGCDEAE